MYRRRLRRASERSPRPRGGRLTAVGHARRGRVSVGGGERPRPPVLPRQGRRLRPHRRDHDPTRARGRALRRAARDQGQPLSFSALFSRANSRSRFAGGVAQARFCLQIDFQPDEHSFGTPQACSRCRDSILASDVLAAARTRPRPVCRVARMARFGVRSGSLERSLEGRFRTTKPCRRTGANGRERLHHLDKLGVTGSSP